MALLEMPRERLLRFGAQALSDAELLSVLLSCACRGTTALEVARALLQEAGGLAGLFRTEDHLLSRRGMGRVRAAVLLAAREVACRVTRDKIVERELLSRPEAVVSYLSLRFGLCDQEVVGAIYLDARHRLIAEQEIFCGTMRRTAVEPRQILKEALHRHAAAVVIFHTHPSGDPSPSAEDLAFTRRLADAADVVGIRLADHLILGTNGRWFSMKRHRGL